MSVSPYFYYDSPDSTFLFAFFSIYAAILIVSLFFWSAVLGIGPYKMAKNAGLPHAWAAFLPIGSVYTIGRLADRSRAFYNGRPSRFACWLLVLQIVSLVCLPLFFVSIFARIYILSALLMLFCAGSGISALVLYYCSLYQVYKDYTPGDELLFLLLSIFISISTPIVLIINRNVVPVSVAGYQPYGQPRYNRPASQPQYGPVYPQYGPAPQQPDNFPTGYTQQPNGPVDPGYIPPQEPPYSGSADAAGKGPEL